MPAEVEVSVRFCNHPKEPGSLTEECPDCRSHLVQVRSFPCLLLLKDRTKPCLIIAPKACFSLHVLAPVSSEVVFRSAAEAFHAAKSSEGWAVSSQQCLFPGHCGCSFRRGQSKAWVAGRESGSRSLASPDVSCSPKPGGLGTPPACLPHT